MVTEDERRTVRDKISEAEATCVELSAALEGVGITLPSLHVDAASYVDTHPQARIYLGGCSTDTARRLAAALGGTGSEPVVLSPSQATVTVSRGETEPRPGS